MSKTKSFLLWVIAIVITVSLMTYQRMTGPTYPKKVQVELDGQIYDFKLLRSSEIGFPCDINLPVENLDVKAKISYKKYKVDEPWHEEEMSRKIINKKAFFGKGEEISILTAILPEQPAAGKVEYKIELYKGNKLVSLMPDKPVVVRFKGFVPRYILVPHVIFMILSLFFATRAGVEVSFSGEKAIKFVKVTLVVLGIGGLILGPIVQKYDFGDFWTGWPFGGDWTDNKTIFAWLFWLIAYFVLRKNSKNKLWTLIAVVVIFAMYLIPHSMGGSELDNSTGKIETGMQE